MVQVESAIYFSFVGLDVQRASSGGGASAPIPWNERLENMVELLRRFILNFACVFRKNEVAYAMVFWTGEDVKQASRLRAVREILLAVDLLKKAHIALHHKPDLSFWPLDQQEEPPK